MRASRVAGALVRSGVVAVALTLVAAGCGGSGGSTAGRATTSTRSSTTTLSPQLAGLPDPASFLLSTPSLPAGWTEQPTSPPAVGPCNGPTDDANAPGARSARRQWIGDAQVIQEAYAFPSVAAATTFLDTVRAQVRSCPSWTTQIGGQPVTSAHSDVSMRAMGDDEFAYHVVVTSPAEKDQEQGDYVYVRKGRNVVGIFLGGSYSSPPALERLAAVALAKLP